MKLLIDMNLWPGWIPYLADFGIEAIHRASVGRADAPDIEILTYSRDHGFVILTQDIDFGCLLAITQHAKPSIVQIRSEDVAPEAIGQRIVQALKQMQAELEAGAIVTVDPVRARLRLLPFE
jgi:predicted nuclease of predicted toxin-antitoxin system